MIDGAAVGSVVITASVTTIVGLVVTTGAEVGDPVAMGLMLGGFVASVVGSSVLVLFVGGFVF